MSEQMSEQANLHTDNGSKNVGLRQLVCFRLGDEDFGVNINNVQEITGWLK